MFTTVTGLSSIKCRPTLRACQSRHPPDTSRPSSSNCALSTSPGRGLRASLEVSVSFLVGETPDEKDAELLAMYRDLKNLSRGDREKIRAIMKVFKKGARRNGRVQARS